MVDFKKQLSGAAPEQPTDPVSIYAGLDRASDKGPLRPAQEAVLTAWQAERRTKRDVILKMHTGQGKTLVGLLILQARLNSGGGPAVYLCPSVYLARQTIGQAEQFGIPTCSGEGDLPWEFLDSKKILVTTTQKLFNGLTKFGLGNNSQRVGAVIVDDAHASVEAIRDAFRIRLPRHHPAYGKLVALFAESLRKQGAGSLEEVLAGGYGPFLPVPYWAWNERQDEVVSILSEQRETQEVKFQWPLLRDGLGGCQCVVSGPNLEIEPYLPDLDLLGSFAKAEHRVFMSATTADDSFLVKGLRVDPDAIKSPLLDPNEAWSGEKMILMPSLLDESLPRNAIVNMFGKPNDKTRFGIVALVPSANRSSDWGECRAVVARTNNIEAHLTALRNGKFGTALVLVNRYDGVDLPDSACRLLVFDSKPHAECLADRYEDNCRPESEITGLRTAKRIEQGLGRSVRGEKDYSVIFMIGEDLVRAVRSTAGRAHLSAQTRAQIEIGLETTNLARQDIGGGAEPAKALVGVVNQCLRRNDGWKQFYVDRMNAAPREVGASAVLDVLQQEFRAESEARAGNASRAKDILQALLDDKKIAGAERGWYLQTMARFVWSSQRAESEKIQAAAHRLNRYLLKPRTGVEITSLQPISQKRVNAVIDWMRSHGTYEEIRLSLDDVLADLSMGVVADKFEAALDRLGTMLGFATQRPDKEYNQGPDNLWALRDANYLLVECKNEVDSKRVEVNKAEANQMNGSTVWFEQKYPDASVTRVLVHPGRKLTHGASLDHQVRVMRVNDLTRFKRAVRDFFAEFRDVDVHDLDERRVQEALDRHRLGTSGLADEYSREIRR